MKMLFAISLLVLPFKLFSTNDEKADKEVIQILNGDNADSTAYEPSEAELTMNFFGLRRSTDKNDQTACKELFLHCEEGAEISQTSKSILTTKKLLDDKGNPVPFVTSVANRLKSKQ